MHRSPLPVPVCVCAFQRAARFGGGGLYGKVGATFLAALPEGAWRRAGVVLGGLGSRKRSEGAGTVIIIVIAVGNWPTGGGGEGELRPTRHQCGCGWGGGWGGWGEELLCIDRGCAARFGSGGRPEEGRRRSSCRERRQHRCRRCRRRGENRKGRRGLCAHSP